MERPPSEALRRALGLLLLRWAQRLLAPLLPALEAEGQDTRLLQTPVHWLARLRGGARRVSIDLGARRTEVWSRTTDSPAPVLQIPPPGKARVDWDQVRAQARRALAQEARPRAVPEPARAVPAGSEPEPSAAATGEPRPEALPAPVLREPTRRPRPAGVVPAAASSHSGEPEAVVARRAAADDVSAPERAQAPAWPSLRTEASRPPAAPPAAAAATPSSRREVAPDAHVGTTVAPSRAALHDRERSPDPSARPSPEPAAAQPPHLRREAGHTERLDATRACAPARRAPVAGERSLPSPALAPPAALRSAPAPSAWPSLEESSVKPVPARFAAHPPAHAGIADRVRALALASHHEAARGPRLPGESAETSEPRSPWPSLPEEDASFREELARELALRDALRRRSERIAELAREQRGDAWSE